MKTAKLRNDALEELKFDCGIGTPPCPLNILLYLHDNAMIQ